MWSKTEKKKFLEKQKLFRELPESEIDALAESARMQQLKRREVLCQKGEDGDHIYLVVRGCLAAKSAGADGTDIIFSLLRPGAVSGELAVLSGGKRSATLIALQNSSVLTIERRDLMPLLQKHPDAAMAIIRVLAERVINLTEMVEDVKFHPISTRLGRLLLKLLHDEGRETERGYALQGYTQKELAKMVVVGRESVNKHLGRWSRQGILSIDGSVITVFDVDRLAAEISGDEETEDEGGAGDDGRDAGGSAA